MAQLEFLAPTSVEDAVRALAGAAGAKVLGGGTDLIVQMRAGRAKPGRIVDLKHVPGAIGVRRAADGGFVIGAATPGAIIGEDAALTRAWPGVVEAANLIGSTQIQGRASLGGNVCNASPAADSVPALVAARAVCVVVGPKGRREVPVEEIQTGPGRTSLAADEFVLEFKLPSRPARSGDAYLRLIPRTEMDIAVAGAGVSLALDEAGRISQAHVALGAVAPTVILVEEAGHALVGSALEEPALARLEQAAQQFCNPISDKRGTAEYRTRIAGVLARRAANIAFSRANKPS